MGIFKSGKSPISEKSPPTPPKGSEKNEKGSEKSDKVPPTPPKDEHPNGPLPTYTSATASSSTAFQTQFASISMHAEDKFRLLQFPNEMIDVCRRATQAIWRRGIQSERAYGASWEFKLHGNPWRGMSSDSIEARRLVCGLLAALHDKGWVLMLSTDISKKNWDKDTLLFRHQVPAPFPCDWCCVAFSKQDRLRFIDAPQEIFGKMNQRLGRSRVQDVCEYSPGVNEIKLVGTPWWANGLDTMKARELLLILLEVLETEGWTVYASVDQKNGGDNYTETDTWHCCRPKGWRRGAPVYHN